MKLRIKGNSIRLRLTQGELEEFQELGMVETTVKFGNMPSAQMNYILKRSSGKQIEATFNLNKIIVNIPEGIAEKWITTAQVSLQEEMSINENESLLILVEKDFKCLKERPNEDESDLFPNPEMGILKC